MAVDLGLAALVGAGVSAGSAGLSVFSSVILIWDIIFPPMFCRYPWKQMFWKLMYYPHPTPLYSQR